MSVIRSGWILPLGAIRATGTGAQHEARGPRQGRRNHREDQTTTTDVTAQTSEHTTTRRRDVSLWVPNQEQEEERGLGSDDSLLFWSVEGVTRLQRAWDGWIFFLLVGRSLSRSGRRRARSRMNMKSEMNVLVPLSRIVLSKGTRATEDAPTF